MCLSGLLILLLPKDGVFSMRSRMLGSWEGRINSLPLALLFISSMLFQQATISAYLAGGDGVVDLGMGSRFS